MAQLPDLTGRRLPGGRYRISAEDNRAWCAAVGANVEPTGLAHPMFGYVAGQVGMGLSVEQLLALCDFDIADGPLMTSVAISHPQSLRVEIDYIVVGEIVSLVRKPSRAFGVADTLEFRTTLVDPEGDVATVCTSRWMLPRRGFSL